MEVLKGSQSAAEFGTKVHELLEKIFDKNFHNWKLRVYKFLDDRFKGYVAPETEERKAEIETKRKSSSKIYSKQRFCPPRRASTSLSFLKILKIAVRN